MTTPPAPDGNGHHGDGHHGNGDGNGHGHGDREGGSDGGAAVVAAHRPTIRALPNPVVKRSRLPSLLVWLVPLATAVGAAVYFAQIYRDLGPQVTILFADVTGVRTGETPVVVRGVRIGTVTAVQLAPDNVHAQVLVRFQRGTGPIANTETLFYLVRPEVSGGNFQGLSTLITGPYITAVVGHGTPTTTFNGLDSPPVMRGAGMRVVIHAARADHLGVDAPIYYRGVQVGVVQDLRLSQDSAGVNVTAFIWLRYAKLVHTDSRFWPLTTAEVKGGLLGGISVQLGSLRTLLGGGLAFATPDDGRASLAQDGSQFDLAMDGPRPQWLAWTPRIPLGPDLPTHVETGFGAQQEQGLLQSAVRVR